jgi:heat shock protein HtpX
MGGRDDEHGNPVLQMVFLLLAPIAAMMLQFAVSRQREFEADRVGAEIAGNPLPLAHALGRLDSLAHQIPMRVAPAAAPLAQVNPLAATAGGFTRLFSTHPPTGERIARLEAMARGR